MIECTLQEAIELYRKNNGGRFTQKHCEPRFPWCVVLPNGYVVFESTEVRADLNCKYFDQIWVYEPPKKSAFQKWESTQSKEGLYNSGAAHLCRKEGWNGAIASILRLEPAVEISGQTNTNLQVNRKCYSGSEIKELKEP